MSRYGGLCLGESTHLVDEVRSYPVPGRDGSGEGLAFLEEPVGRLSLPVWVDHVGSAGTRHATGSLRRWPTDTPPDLKLMPRIEPWSTPHDPAAPRGE